MRDLDEFLDGSLKLPIGGREYVIPPVDAETGLMCTQLFEAGTEAAAGRTPSTPALLDDIAEVDLYRRVLADAYDEMISAHVPWVQLRHAALTVVFYVAAGPEAGEAYWESPAGSGEAAAPNRAARRASSGTGSSTRSRGSTSGTTSARSTPRKAPARKSPGRKS